MSEQRADIDDIFSAAIEIDSPQARQAYVRQACGDDQQLLQQVEKLLAAHFRAGDFLDSPAPGLPTELPEGIAPGTTIGPYKLLEQIGEGGMGVVFQAEQTRPVQRRVALKIIKLGMDTRQVIARFEAERQALAVMDHPNVAKVFDAGATDTGRPYFVMELVKGTPITEYCDRFKLNVRDRLELFQQVCHAVHHAHQKGLIHRDIKPSNILVSTHDDKPMAKVIDFGIAKATQARLTEKTLFTEFHQLIGTPEYMSPEQAEGSLDIDTRTDVYSLGVLLYELLVGCPPFDAKELRSKAYAEMQRIIREVDPPTPSTRLSTLEALPSVAAQRGTEPRKLSAAVRGELDWIVMKALEKDRKRRYESPSSLAADIVHYLADEPVSASPPSRTYRLRKFVRRNRAAVLGVSIISLLLIGGITGTTMGLLEARKQRDAANQQAAIAEAVSTFQADMLASADPDRLLGEKVTVVQAITAAAKELDDGKLKDQPLVEARVRMVIGATLARLGQYNAAEPHLRKSLEIRRSALPATHIDIAGSLNELGQLLPNLGRLDEAEALQRESLSVRRRGSPVDESSVAQGLNNLATLLYLRGKYSETEAMLREALALFRKTHPGDNHDTALTLHNLATILREQGKLADAETPEREALAMNRRLLAPGHPSIAGHLISLGQILQDAGRMDEAERLMREALELRRKALPPEHRDIAHALQCYAAFLFKWGRASEAEPHAREGLDIARRALPSGHPDIDVFVSTLAAILQGQGKLEEAEPLYREALESQRRSLPANHPALVTVINNLASLLSRRGKSAEAEQLYREALAIGRASLPANHPHTALILGNIGSSLMDQGRPAEAEPSFRESINVFEAVFGKGCRQSGTAWLGLGTALARLGRRDQAEPALLAAEAALRADAGGGTRHPYGECIDELVALYAALANEQPGKGYDLKARQWRDKLPATQPATTQSTSS